MTCINLGPGTEAINQDYSDQPFQALAIDVWDGGSSQVNIFATNSGVTYPILMFGGSNGIQTDYSCPYDYLFVIGGDGVILWRGHYNNTAIRGAIDAGLAALASPAPQIPEAGHRLLAGYPNPFNPTTRIPFELGAGTETVPVRLEIMDLRGRLVRTLADGPFAGGRRHEVVWNGTDTTGHPQPSGTYLVRFEAGDERSIRAVTLVK